MNTYDKMHVQPVENAYLLEKKMAEIEKAVTLLPAPELQNAFNVWLKDEKAAIAKAKEDFRFQFGNQLKEQFEKDNIKIRGQYPLLRIGLFTLRINFEFGEATLFFGPEVEKLKSKIPLQTQAIYDVVRQYEHSMKEESFDAQKGFDDLVNAYERCIEFAGKQAGEKMRITDVLREYVFLKQPKQFLVDPSRGRFREYPRIKLSYMLYRLKAADIAARGMRFHVATFDSTVDKLRSFWIPDNEAGEGTHYEYLSFEPPHE